MESTAVTMWYENSVLMSFIGVVLGGFIGFIGSIIQSRIAARNSIDVVKAQSANELLQHRYIEKEKLYSELIGFVPQFTFAVDISSKKISLSREQKIQLNSFKARLAIYSTQVIYEEFYGLICFLGQESNEEKVTERIDSFTEMLLEDLNKSIAGNVQKKSKKEKAKL